VAVLRAVVASPVPGPERDPEHRLESPTFGVRPIQQERASMKRTGMSLVAALVLLWGGAQPLAAAPSKKKGAASAKAGGAAPAASQEEIKKLKGDFKWGMTSAEVAQAVAARIEASYQEKLQKSAGDPTTNDQIRKQMRADIEQAKKNVVRFDGGKTGYDVSIIDEEFSHNMGESMLVAKEETSTRYFFFTDDRLYKMFIAFDKEMLAGKSFEEFGALMQARFGKAKEVRVEQKGAGAAKAKVDHYEWGGKSGDGLRLVDRSEFYDVYCLVVYDAAIEGRVAQAHRDGRKAVDRRDALVEAVTSAPGSDRDNNDDIVERITGKQVPKPGVRQENIKVPSPTTATQSSEAASPLPEEGRGAGSAEPAKKKASRRGKDGGKAVKETDGLKL
jgi:hypothetical protein